jgi:uncharacterized protein YdaU (DUF1376 family)
MGATNYVFINVGRRCNAFFFGKFMADYHYIRWFPSDYMRDTRRLSQQEHGAYFLLLNEYFLTGEPLPDDDSILSRITLSTTLSAWLSVRSACAQYFIIKDGIWFHKRCDDEITFSKNSVASKKLGAKLANKAKTDKKNAEHYAEHYAERTLSAMLSTTLSDTYPEPEPEPYLKQKPKPNLNTNVIFDHWQKKLNHPKSKFDTKRQKAVNARLSDGYTVEDLLLAIDGCSQDSWSMGKNDSGQIYDDLELICRDSAHVDKFMRIAREPSKNKSKQDANDEAYQILFGHDDDELRTINEQR